MGDLWGTWSEFSSWPLVILDDPVSTPCPGPAAAGQQLSRSTWRIVAARFRWFSILPCLLLFVLLPRAYILPSASGGCGQG